MSKLRPSMSSTATVAAWEFKRYFKLKDQLTGLIGMLIGAAVSYGAVSLLGQSVKPVEIAVIGASQEFSFPEEGNLVRAAGDFSREEWERKLAGREIGGLLVISAAPDGNWSAELSVPKEPTWLPEIRNLVQSEKMRWKMEADEVKGRYLADLLAPVDLNLVLLEDRDTSQADRLVAYSLLGAMLITSWIGLAYMMTGITGEKQLRVTEQIVSAIRPQSWIDGKLLGITAASIGSLAFLFLSGLICLLAAWLLDIPVPIPGSLRRWELIPVLIGFYLAGVVFWNYFYAGISAVINDPNTSSRSSLLFLPMLPMIMVGMLVAQPDSTAMRILSLVPGTSAVAMPIRLVLGEVPWLELIASVLLMAAGIALLRLLAGRIFAAGITLYGKEPSWLEIGSWVIRAK